MINYPHNPFRRAAAAIPLAAVRSPFARDVQWNKPVFKAPALSRPPILVELPFLPARVTQRAR